MTREQECEIIARVLGGERDAFAELVDAYKTMVYQLALRICGSAEDAQDAAQEAFLRAYSNLSGFRGDSRFSVWLYRLTNNVCIDFCRARRLRPNVSLTCQEDADDEPEELPIADYRWSPEEELERRELRAAIRRGLDTLPPDMRRILVMREIDGLSYEEIGTLLSLGAGTVKSRLFRARKKLCAFLVQDGNIPAAFASEKQGGEMRDGV